jgi:hypothetical protein
MSVGDPTLLIRPIARLSCKPAPGTLVVDVDSFDALQSPPALTPRYQPVQAGSAIGAADALVGMSAARAGWTEMPAHNDIMTTALLSMRR